VVVQRAAVAAHEVDMRDDALVLTSHEPSPVDCLAFCELDEALGLYAWLVTRRQWSVQR